MLALAAVAAVFGQRFQRGGVGEALKMFRFLAGDYLLGIQYDRDILDETMKLPLKKTYISNRLFIKPVSLILAAIAGSEWDKETPPYCHCLCRLSVMQ